MRKEDVLNYLKENFEEYDHLFLDFIKEFFDDYDGEDKNLLSIDDEFRQFIENNDLSSDLLGDDYDWDSGNEDRY